MKTILFNGFYYNFITNDGLTTTKWLFLVGFVKKCDFYI